MNMSKNKKLDINLGIRVILLKGNNVLVVKQKKPNGRFVHILPGGGIEEGENIFAAAKREIEEETNLKIEPLKLLYLKEIFDPYRHNFEFYVLGKIKAGKASLGYDPEKDVDNQCLSKVYFISLDRLKDINFYPQELRIRLKKDWQQDFKNISTYLGCQKISPAQYKRLFGNK